MKRYAVSILLVCTMTLFFSCSRDKNKDKTADKRQGAEVSELTLMTHDSFSVSAGVIDEFQKNNHVKVHFLKSGDAGEALNKAILSKNNPLADVFFGVDNSFLTRALKENIFIPYKSPLLVNINSSLKLDPTNRLVPVDFGDVCINYDKKWFKEKKLLPPVMLEDLVKPEFKNLVVVENPATSSPGLAFLFATISRFGEDGYLDFWKKLTNNNLLVVNGWKEAYWGKFSAASKGSRPVVVSYASSPAAEVYFSKKKLDKAPTGVVINNGAAFRQIEFAGILKGTSKLKLSKKFIDFMLSKKFQEDIPLQMFVFPANKKAALPKVFKDYAKITDHPATLPYDLISKKRDTWLEQWTETVL